MGTVAFKYPNPLISDMNDPRYTPLHNFNYRQDTRALIADLGATLGNQILEHIYAEENFPNDNNPIPTIKVGDIAVLGNRVGLVTGVVYGDDSNGGNNKLIALKVQEDMRYLPVDMRATPTDYGYKNDRAREVVYLFSNVDDPADIAAITGGEQVIEPGQRSLYTGQIGVLRSRTYDPQTWNQTSRALKKFQEQYSAPTLVTLEVTDGVDTHDITDAEKKLVVDYLNNEVDADIPYTSTPAEIEAVVDALGAGADYNAFVARFNGVAQ